MAKILFQNLKELEIFNGLNENTLKQIERVNCVKSLRKGQILFLDKDRVNNIYIVLEGKVSIFKISEASNKKIMFILGKGEIINEVIIENDLSEASSCEAFEESELIVINRTDFINIMMMDFEFNKRVLSSLTKKVRRLYRQIKNTNMLKIEKRLAAKLYKLAKDYGIKEENKILINVKISVTYLSDMLGVSRETVSRALKTLQNMELVFLQNRSIYINDLNKLINYFKNN